MCWYMTSFAVASFPCSHSLKKAEKIYAKWNDCFGVEQLSKIHTLIFKLYWFLYTFFQPEDISNWVYWISYWITLILGRAEVKQSVRAGSIKRAEVKQSVRAGSIAKGRFVVLPSGSTLRTTRCTPLLANAVHCSTFECLNIQILNLKYPMIFKTPGYLQCEKAYLSLRVEPDGKWKHLARSVSSTYARFFLYVPV